jgi:hypothetical protein
MSRTAEENLSTSDFVATGERGERKNTGCSEGGGTAALPPQNSAQDLRGEWDRIQAAFVDDPRSSVKQADELVASAMKWLAESFAQPRGGLERQWESRRGRID